MNIFVPLNELESALSKTQTGSIPRKQFIQLLVDSELTVSSVTEIMPDGSGFLPLLLKKEQAQMLVCFTEHERIGKYAEMAPYCVNIHGKDLLQRLPEGFGLVINPGLSVSLEITPKEMPQLLKDFLV